MSSKVILVQSLRDLLALRVKLIRLITIKAGLCEEGASSAKASLMTASEKNVIHTFLSYTVLTVM
jgi:hypothetical protein